MPRQLRALSALFLGTVVASACAVAGAAQEPAHLDGAPVGAAFEGVSAAIAGDVNDDFPPLELPLPSPTPPPPVTPPQEEPRVQPAARAPVPVTPPRAPRPVVAPRPPAPSCAADSFCYPRLGIAGRIIPYTDCTGRTDVGSAIRSVNCVSTHWLAAHAWTQFGRIVNWQSGDVVFAYGARFVIYGAYTQQACTAPSRAAPPLAMQTSLSSAACGPVLVVMARPG